MCTDFKMLQVKVPIIFFGTQGFSARRDGRYSFTFHLTLRMHNPPCVLCAFNKIYKVYKIKAYGANRQSECRRNGCPLALVEPSLSAEPGGVGRAGLCKWWGLMICD